LLSNIFVKVIFLFKKVKTKFQQVKLPKLKDKYKSNDSLIKRCVERSMVRPQLIDNAFYCSSFTENNICSAKSCTCWYLLGK